jgi:DNA-directed RNA polymerase subunit RPC12/RpoP
MTIKAKIMEISQNKTSWQPPDNFIPVASEVEGVTVYAPAPETPEPLKKVVYKCPQCGATTRYEIAAGGVACEHCGYRAGSQAKTVGKKAEEFEFTLDILEQSDQGWGIQRHGAALRQLWSQQHPGRRRPDRDLRLLRLEQGQCAPGPLRCTAAALPDPVQGQRQQVNKRR